MKLILQILVVLACLMSSVVNSLAFSVVDRRKALATAFGGTSAFLAVNQLGFVPPVLAADAGPTKEELDRIVKGYKQINYLLDHFDVRT
jgi:hypothetical protein